MTEKERELNRAGLQQQCQDSDRDRGGREFALWMQIERKVAEEHEEALRELAKR